jgi:hypothetical protein
MNQLLLVYVLVFLMVLAMLLLAMRNDGTLSQRLSRVRVRIEENRHRSLPDPPEEEFKLDRALELFVLSIILLFICMLLIKV